MNTAVMELPMNPSLDLASAPPLLRGGSPEKRKVTLGFIPLTDCALLVAAKELGLFERRGVEVTLSREPSWSAIRDKVTFGVLDGAHMLAPMPLASTLGVSGMKTPMLAAACLGLNGNAVVVSNALFQTLENLSPDAAAQRPMSAAPLRRVIEQREQRGEPPLTLGVVFPYSMHNYLLRTWLAGAGIDADSDLRLIVVPPQRMFEYLCEGCLDGYCVGEPWSQLAVQCRVGRVVTTGHDIWPGATEKVLGVTGAWAEANPGTLQALVSAIHEAGQWADQPQNRAQLSDWLSRPEYLDVPRRVLSPLQGQVHCSLDEPPRAMPQFNVFSATAPQPAHAVAMIGQMIRWRQVDEGVEMESVANRVFRRDLHDAAIRATPPSVMR